MAIQIKDVYDELRELVLEYSQKRERLI